MHLHRGTWLALALLPLIACGNPIQSSPAGSGPGAEPGAATKGGGEVGEAVTPPFPVQGELEGMLLVWFDAEGPHSVDRRSDVPEANRKTVRIDSLAVPPSQRLDPDHVYVADLSRPDANGSYSVRKHTRAWFEAQVQGARPPEPEVAAAGVDNGVTVYMASWCGACKAAESYLRSRNVGFQEKDVEKDPVAQNEMLAKARAAGKNPSGVPVIDFRGNIVLGFNQGVLDDLIKRYP